MVSGRAIRDAAQAMRRNVGRGWDFMTHEVRVQFVYGVVLGIVRAQEKPMAVDEIDRILALALEAVGLDSE